MGPTDLHKAEKSSGPARGAFLLIKRVHTRIYTSRMRARTRASFIKGAQTAHERAGTQKRRACLVALTIRPPTYEISRFIIILLSTLSLSLPFFLAGFLSSAFTLFPAVLLPFLLLRRPFARSPVRMRWTLHARWFIQALFSGRARVCLSSI